MTSTRTPVRISIKYKLLLYILLATIVIFTSIFGYIVNDTNNNSVEDAHKFVNSTAQQYANDVKATLDSDIGTCRSLASAFSGYKDIDNTKRYDIYNHIMKDILINHPQFISIWTSWELGALDLNFKEENGRDRLTYYRENNEIKYTFETIEVGETNLGGIYYDLKSNPREVLTDPYFDSYANNLDKEILESSIAIPLLDNGKFVGLTGVDIELERFHKVIGEITPFEGSYAIMISSTGQIISHPDPELINTSLFETDLNLHAGFDVSKKMKAGLPFSYTENNEDEAGLFISFAPFNPGNSADTWYIVIVVPTDVILLNAERTFRVSTLVALLGILLLAFLIWFIANRITKPLVKTTNILNKLSTGNVKDLKVTNLKRHDELAEMTKALQTLTVSLKLSADFATNIGEGNLSKTYNPLSKNDVLGNALLHMRNNLQELQDVNNKNRWMQTSLVRINELLQGEKSITGLGDLILTSLAEILDVQIASLFFSEDGVLVLSSSYSYNVRKSNLNKFKFGEGLIGQSAKEQKLLIFTDVPDDYISIKSGLGETIPREIVVIPLIYRKQVIAIIELGTTKAFTSEKIEFITQISENLALGFNSIKTREEMKILLERTQSQAEELRVQQEELVSSNKELEDQTNALKVSEEELQQQQEELRVTNEELEEKTNFLEQQRIDITNKNLDLENIGKNLEQKAKELELASKYKSEFLANMSHELRTPLNSLLILSGSLSENREGNLNEEQVESATIIYKSGNDLLAMINDILDLSKIESGKMDVNLANVAIDDMSNNIRDYFKHGITNKSLEFIVEVDDNIPNQLSTDQQKVEQILKNFMSNALKFTESGSITLHFHSADKQPNSLCISVIDTGIGIPEDKQMAIFEAFQQADGSISRRFGGTGLGLSISRELAKLLGGKITLKSQIGEGSTFTFCLPTDGSNAKTSEKQTTKSIESSKNIAFNSKKENIKKLSEITENLSDTKHPSYVKDDFDDINKGEDVILIIEDDPNFAKILHKQCNDRGFKSVVSQTGEYGLKLADQLIPSAIILDIKLPGIDGWRVLDILKENATTRHIPVHIMSGEDETIAASTKGAIGFLTKPVKKGVLDTAFGTIETFINKKTGNLLLIEDDENLRRSIKILIGDKGVKITDAPTGKEALTLLKENNYDCMILDLGLSDMSGFELIEELNNSNYHRPPIIVYTGKDLTKKENDLLQKYAESIIIKGVKSEERLLDETALFMHRVITEMPVKQQAMIKKIHNTESVFKDKRVLIVDDDMRNVFALTKILTEQKMIVSRAENGHVALENVNNNPEFDIILMDIMMPGMDGYETMQEIRKLPNQRKVPIIALTAKAMKEDRQKCIEAGANDYMAKPIVIEKLLSLLRVWLYK